MIDEVVHKFFVPRHSMMDCDRDFCCISEQSSRMNGNEKTSSKTSVKKSGKK